jgi:hypothetical protein
MPGRIGPVPFSDLGSPGKVTVNKGYSGKVGRMRGRNIAITGLGQSGTTLACHLLNKVHDTVALSEPMAPDKFEDLMPDTEAACDGIEEFFDRMRRMALGQGEVLTKHKGGVVPDNPKATVAGVRQRVIEKGRIPVGKDLSEDFLLAIKDVTMFTPLLPTLSGRMPCYAIVRNPLAVVASTLSLPAPGWRALEIYAPGLAAHLKIDPDPISRQLARNDFFFGLYAEYLPTENVIRYEDMIGSGGKALSIITSSANLLNEPLESRNLNPLYDRDGMLRIGERLLERDGACWRFYTRESVEGLLAAV